MAVEKQTVPTPTEAVLPAQINSKQKNLIKLIQDWPLSRKIATGTVVLISVILFSALIFQAKTAHQQLLYAKLSTHDASAVANWLKTQKEPYTLKNSGHDIWISADKIYQTRLDLAANGLPNGGETGFEIFDKQNFALTDFVQKVNHTRALQGELSRTITSLKPIESTRIHLALPEKRLFKNQQKKATASVIITLVPGRKLEKKQVQGIVHLVAASVLGLDPDYVSVIDSNGIELERLEDADENNTVSLNMLKFQEEVENRLELRAQDLLDKTMGKDHAVVRVSATLDFSKVEKTEEIYDGDDPVIRSEQLNNESSSTKISGGIPGVESNLNSNIQSQSNSGPAASNTSRITNYEISKTISKIVNPVGTITNLSVSVLIADRVKVDSAGKATSTTPLSAEELKSIENMVATAIGLVKDRGDLINVLSMPFIEKIQPLAALDQPSENSFYQYIPFIKYALILLGVALIYFLLLRPVIKTMKGEVQKHNKTVRQLELEQIKIEDKLPPPPPVDDAITTLRREVEQNHIPTAFIVKNWIQEG